MGKVRSKQKNLGSLWVLLDTHKYMQTHMQHTPGQTRAQTQNFDTHTSSSLAIWSLRPFNALACSSSSFFILARNSSVPWPKLSSDFFKLSLSSTNSTSSFLMSLSNFVIFSSLARKALAWSDNNLVFSASHFLVRSSYWVYHMGSQIGRLSTRRFGPHLPAIGG